jgi:hypothetical protein
MVDIAGDALKNLLDTTEGMPAKVGTFTKVVINNCPTDTVAGDNYFQFTGQATINSVVYYTNATSGLSTTPPAEEVKVTGLPGCSSGSYLPEALEITADGLEVPEDTSVEPVDDEGEALEEVTEGTLKGNIPVKVYFDIANAAYASGGTSSTASNSMGQGCAGTTPQLPHICLNFPKIIGTVDSAEPTVSRMLMSGHTIWGFYTGSSETPFGAYQRLYYDGSVYTTFPENFMGPDFKKIEKNADGTFKVRTYDDGRYLNADEFQFADHSGTFDWAGTDTAYTAVKLP